MLKQRLQQKLLQKLSPQQIQMIKLLEVPTLQIEQRIKKELEENPALEEGAEEEDIPAESEEDQYEENDRDQEEFTIDDYIEEDDIPEYRLQAKNYSKDEEKRSEIPFSVGFSFHEHLESQLGLRDLTDKQKILGEYILGNIDEDGYLRRELINIVDDLAFLQNVETTESELEEVLLIIQDLEPAGVGARTLRECLLLQIEKRDNSQPSMKLAHSILELHFEEFTKRHYDKIISRLGITENELKAAIDEILKLNPKPGGVYSDPFNKTSQPIIPDFILELSEDGFDLHLNSKNLPELRLSSAYSEMLTFLQQR
jgi:RNA polymerase sigma-54 factor